MQIQKGIVIATILLQFSLAKRHRRDDMVHFSIGRTRGDVRGRALETEDSSGFDPFRLPGPSGQEYYLSRTKTNRENAIKSCTGYSPPNGKKLSLLVLESDHESDFIRNELKDGDSTCIWVYANLLKDPVNNTERLVTFSPKGKSVTDVTGRESKPKIRRHVTREERASGGTIITIKETIYPFINKKESGEDCNIIPKCKPAECTLTMEPCSKEDKNCFIKNNATCSIISSGDCTANCDNCTITKPKCEVFQEPCRVEENKKCIVKPPACKILSVPECTVTRPPCITLNQPCNIVRPPQDPICSLISNCPIGGGVNCTFAKPNCTKDPTGKRKCDEPFLDIRNCQLNPICLLPVICKKEAIVCPPPQAICFPEVVKCTQPKIECGKPTLECTEPKVVCPKPEFVCTQPVVTCSSPVIHCPSVVATCPHPEVECPPPIVNCKPPDVQCEKHEPCSVNDNQANFMECPKSMECGENCECVKLAKESNYDWKGAKCEEECFAVCEG